MAGSELHKHLSMRRRRGVPITGSWISSSRTSLVCLLHVVGKGFVGCCLSWRRTAQPHMVCQDAALCFHHLAAPARASLP